MTCVTSSNAIEDFQKGVVQKIRTASFITYKMSEHIAYKGSEDHRYNVLNFIICHCSCARIRLLDYKMLWNWLDMQM